MNIGAIQPWSSGVTTSRPARGIDAGAQTTDAPRSRAPAERIIEGEILARHGARADEQAFAARMRAQAGVSASGMPGPEAVRGALASYARIAAAPGAPAAAAHIDLYA